jgi:anti-sigma28 factor (negative regulator of flagellin synthesis)
LGDIEGNSGIVTIVASLDASVAPSASIADKSTTAALVVTLLNHIRLLDRLMDEARIEKIVKIKKSLADGTYRVDAAEVASKIIGLLQEP